jgi:hypothetical protein
MWHTDCGDRTLEGAALESYLMSPSPGHAPVARHGQVSPYGTRLTSIVDLLREYGAKE